MDQDEKAAYLGIAVTAALEAGKLLRDSYRKVEAREKGPGDLVTEADFKAQALIREVLLSRFPDHAFLGEEAELEPSDSGFRWLVDPLDGTINFAHGVEPWGVSIALENQGSLIAGVVHLPIGNATYTATAGGGAFENGSPIRVSSAADLANALVAAGMPTSFHEDRERQLAIMERFSTGTHGVRRTGSSAFNLARLAAGNFDVCYATSVHSWDVAAGVLLVREAGGVVTNMSGGPFAIDRPEILATNGALHNRALAAVRTAWPRIGDPGDRMIK